MAEALARSLVDGIGFFSRGLAAWDGQPASGVAVDVLMEAFGVDLSAHRARIVDNIDVERAGLILTMTRGHRARMNELYPSAADKIFTLGEIAGEDISDVGDPFGGGDAEYRDCAEMLRRLILAIDFTRYI
jgi:protein-tyrosine phosphatase